MSSNSVVQRPNYSHATHIAARDECADKYLGNAVSTNIVRSNHCLPDDVGKEHLHDGDRDRDSHGHSSDLSDDEVANIRDENDDDQNTVRVDKIMALVSREKEYNVLVGWPDRNEEAFLRGKPELKSLILDATSFDEDDLLHLTLEIFLEVGVHEKLGIPTDKMKRFILGVRDRMLDNPYHNWTHVFDVMQTVYSLATMCRAFDKLSDIQTFALIVSALCHDLEHPGVNNLFLIKSRSSLATLYNETSILEKHHAFRAFELMFHANTDLLSSFTPEQYADFREIMMSIILATDMARHGDYMARLKQILAENEGKEGQIEVDELFLMEIIIKCADTANVLKPFEVAKKWALRVTDEFFLQGDMERASGMEVTPICDRTSQSRVAVQKGFIDFVITPFYTLVGNLLPDLLECFKQIQINRQAWDAYDDAMLVEEVGKHKSGLLPSNGEPVSLRIVTWNIAAVNNNPFEYWITHGQTRQSADYASLMQEVQLLIDNPEGRDFEIKDIISDEMVAEVKAEMESFGLEGLDEWENRWKTEYKHRLAISGFLKDKAIGSKRLISMPDRVTNTINSEGSVLMRPSVISMFDGDCMGSLDEWWVTWKDYMFHRQVKIIDRNKPGVSNELFVIEMLQKIAHSKYPAITEEEEAISIPLQVIVLAVFDAILIHILNSLAPTTWQPIKRSLCQAFNQNKSLQVLSILKNTYSDVDVFFIQEAAAGFVDAAKQVMGRKYMVMRPYLLDGFRNQNSIILASREFFVEGSTEHVIRLAGGGKWIAPGDLCAMTMKGVDGFRYLLASFHGDTNGLASLPVLKALHEAITTSYPDHVFICGIDANTHKQHGSNCQGVNHFHDAFAEMGMDSCWGETPSVKTWTTRNARTYLQPQLQKAVGIADAARKGDVNLKDWLIFYENQFVCAEQARDNTGARNFDEEMVFPTLQFPSDHAIVSALLTRKPS
mmetsp:Transcript_43765/g.138318  ORF Transcript_43765/g.138318 Transcript_43765/m.138318 type:complete len:949 (-) Transcript_43765:52-2898(-)